MQHSIKNNREMRQSGPSRRVRRRRHCRCLEPWNMLRVRLAMRLDDAVKAVNESFFIMLGDEGIRHFVRAGCAAASLYCF